MSPWITDQRWERRWATITIALIIAILILGVSPDITVAGDAGDVVQASTPSCSSPPSHVNWYGLDSAESPAMPTIGTDFWAANTVAIGYETTGPAVGFFVVTDDSGEVIGDEHVADDEAVHVDGLGIDLETSLSGIRTVQVVWHCDANGDGEFEPEIDYAAGARAGPTDIDFDATVATPPQTIVTADAGRTTIKPTNGANSPGQPGFTVLPSLLVIIVSALLIRRR